MYTTDLSRTEMNYATFVKYYPLQDGGVPCLNDKAKGYFLFPFENEL